jgi:phosphatidylethanolamine/phosphatidyl-N-methylethanolamine N-methyltransferase
VLNHFMHAHGPLGFLGRRLGPLANQLGWHSDFTAAPIMSCSRLELVEQRPSPPFGMFTLLRLRKREAERALVNP